MNRSIIPNHGVKYFQIETIDITRYNFTYLLFLKENLILTGIFFKKYYYFPLFSPIDMDCLCIIIQMYVIQNTMVGFDTVGGSESIALRSILFPVEGFMKSWCINASTKECLVCTGRAVTGDCSVINIVENTG